MSRSESTLAKFYDEVIDDRDLVVSPVKMLMREVSGLPLLTASEELSLGQQRFVLDNKLNKLRSLPENNLPEKQRTEIAKAEEQRQVVINKFVKHNIRLVISIAKKNRVEGVPFDDLVQEGSLGLMRAAEKYDYLRGYRFSTYATWWVRQAITRAVAEQGRAIRLPVHTLEALDLIHKMQRFFVEEQGREPEIDELTRILNEREEARFLESGPKKSQKKPVSWTSKKVGYLLSLSGQIPVSLDAPIGVDGEYSLADIIADTTLPPTEKEGVENLQKADFIKAMASVLSNRELSIISLRFGLADGRQRTLEEVGLEVGRTRERVRQIEYKALTKLKGSIRIHGFLPGFEI